MSTQNENNRPQVSLPLRNVASDDSFLCFYAHKAVIIKDMILQFSNVANLTDTNFWSVQLFQIEEGKADLPVAPVVDLNTRIEHGHVEPMPFAEGTDELFIPKGVGLSLTFTRTGGGATPNLRDVFLGLDYQVRGN